MLYLRVELGRFFRDRSASSWTNFDRRPRANWLLRAANRWSVGGLGRSRPTDQLVRRRSFLRRIRTLLLESPVVAGYREKVRLGRRKNANDPRLSSRVGARRTHDTARAIVFFSDASVCIDSRLFALFFPRELFRESPKTRMCAFSAPYCCLRILEKRSSYIPKPL